MPTSALCVAKYMYISVYDVNCTALSTPASLPESVPNFCVTFNFSVFTFWCCLHWSRIGRIETVEGDKTSIAWHYMGWAKQIVQCTVSWGEYKHSSRLVQWIESHPSFSCYVLLFSCRPQTHNIIIKLNISWNHLLSTTNVNHGILQDSQCIQV